MGRSWSSKDCGYCIAVVYRESWRSRIISWGIFKPAPGELGCCGVQFCLMLGFSFVSIEVLDLYINPD